MDRILIADDREIVRTTLRQIIPHADANWEICGEAVDGKDAINKTIELSPDLIILDVTMPQMDGISAARQIRARFPDVPILIYTFLDTPHLELAAKQAGAQGVVQKGDRRALIAEIRKALAARPAGVGPEMSVPSAANVVPLANVPPAAAQPAEPAQLEPPPPEAAGSNALPPDSQPTSDDENPNL